MQNIKNKLCSRCNSVRATTFFQKNKSKNDGLQTRCKDCMSAYYKVKRLAKKGNDVYGKPQLINGGTMIKKIKKGSIRTKIKERNTITGNSTITSKDLEEASKILGKKNPTSRDGARLQKINKDSGKERMMTFMENQERLKRNKKQYDLRLILTFLVVALVIILNQF